MSADPRNQAKGGWVHEDEFRELALQMVADERSEDNERETSFETFLGPKAEESRIITALASVQDFYPGKLHDSTLDNGHHAAQAPGEVRRSSEDCIERQSSSS